MTGGAQLHPSDLTDAQGLDSTNLSISAAERLIEEWKGSYFFFYCDASSDFKGSSNGVYIIVVVTRFSDEEGENTLHLAGRTGPDQWCNGS